MHDFYNLNQQNRRLAQDGRVEGRAITPSCESTGITANCWTIMDRKTLELTKKRDPTSKDRGEATVRWQEGHNHNTIKSHNCWVGDSQTGEHIPQKSTHWSEGSEPQVRLPKLGARQQEEEFLKNQTLKASRIWLQDFDRTGGKRDSILGGHTQSSVCIRTQGKEQWPHRRLKQTYLLMLGGLLKRWEWLCLTVSTRILAAEVLGTTPCREPSQSQPLASPKSPGRLQCWVASGQTTNREGTHPHPSAVKQIKVSLSSAHQSNTQLYPPPVPPIRNLAQAS